MDRRRTILPIAVLGGSMLLGGYFLQEGVSRDENVYVQSRLFQEVVDRISGQYFEALGEGELYESAIEGLMDQLGDPNSSFISASDWEDFSIRATEGRYGGVGLEVIERNGWVTVVSPIPGTPGERAGIRAGDWFVEIAGESAADISVDDAVDILRGEVGSEVDVMMGRPGVVAPIPFTLRRAEIQINSVPFAVKLEGDIGYVPLEVFRETAEDEVHAAIDSLRAEGARAVILDLRGNPGGVLTDGVGISELFLDPGDRIVETRGRGDGQSETYTASRQDAYPGMPVVVLVNERSASASEIVAGALQDHDRALVIGAPTFGKGSVQTLFRLTGGNVLRLTTALWYTPVGRSVQREFDESTGLPSGAVALDQTVAQTETEDWRPEFQSMGGRTILGGGGISPDLWIVPDTLTTSEWMAVRALSLNAGQMATTLFNFSFAYVQAHPDLRPGFTLSEADLQAYRDALIEDGVTGPATAEANASGPSLSEAERSGRVLLEQAGRYLRFQLEREIALQAFGESGEFLRTMDSDLQLQRALDLLRSSDTPEALFRNAG